MLKIGLTPQRNLISNSGQKDENPAAWGGVRGKPKGLRGLIGESEEVRTQIFSFSEKYPDTAFISERTALLLPPDLLELPPVGPPWFSQSPQNCPWPSLEKPSAWEAGVEMPRPHTSFGPSLVKRAQPSLPSRWWALKGGWPFSSQESLVKIQTDRLTCKVSLPACFFKIGMPLYYYYLTFGHAKGYVGS